MLIDKMREDAADYKRTGAKHQAMLLTTLISEAEMVGKNKRNGKPTDEETIVVAKKFSSGVEQNLSYRPDSEELREELELYSEYIPKQLDADELRNAIKGIIASFKGVGPTSMGLVMKALKEKYGSAFDGKLASQIVTNELG